MPRCPCNFLPALLVILLLVLSAKSNGAVVAAFLTENRFCAARPIPNVCTNTLVKQPNNVRGSRIFHVDTHSTILSAKTNDKDEYDDKYLGALDRALQTGDTRKLDRHQMFWVERCLELEEYKRKHGNCDVPQPARRGEKKTKLQNWVTNQRTLYRFYQQGEESSMTGERIAILEGMGFRWEITGWSGEHAGWKVRYEELVEYKGIHGNCNVPREWKENPKLAKWVYAQRVEYRYLKEGRPSTMTDARIDLLDKLGFDWYVNGPQVEWELRYEDLKQYKKQYGDCNVPKYWKENRKLGIWVDNQRQQYRLLKEGKKSPMTAERIAMLEKLEFDWYVAGPNTDWIDRYKELKQYKERYGDCNVPQKSKDYPKLGNWVNSQRAQYRLLKEGKKSDMTAERIAMLEKLEFDWYVAGPNTDWIDRYKELEQYKKQYGDCNVPQRWDENPQLGSWVHKQRQQYRLLKEGKKSQMTAERIAMLEKLEFDWYVAGPNTDWIDRYKELEQYKKQYGDCNVPQRWDENPQLGIWVKKQRAEYRHLKEGKKSQMTAERIDLLEKIGFEWVLKGKRKQTK